ncbi:MAG: hypothetical protein IJP17_00105 [Clostridia bacterium]|nr:hypothetical protein [Clostridia bacterium]
MRKVNIGRTRRERPSSIEYTSLIAMPTPTGWGEKPKCAAPGNMRLDKGEIRFERIHARIFVDRPVLPEPQEDRIMGRLGEDIRRPILPEPQEMPVPRPYVSRANIEEYTHPRDGEPIRRSLLEQMKMLYFRIITGTIIVLFLGVIELMPIVGVPLPDMFLPDKAPIMYLVLSLLMAGFHMLLCRNVVFGGIKSIAKLKPDGEGAISLASIAILLQMVAQLVVCIINRSPVQRVCAAPISLALLINDVGLLMMTRRVARNFSFIAMNGTRRAAQIVDDSVLFDEILHADGVYRSDVAYCVRTKFLSGYLESAYKEDMCEQMTGRLTAYIMYIALAAGVIGGLVGWKESGIFGAIYCLCATLAAGVPVCRLLCLNLPMDKASKSLLRRGAMLNGWAGIEQFGSVDTLAVSAEELFPEGTVRLLSVKAFGEAPIDRSVIYAASIVTAAGGPLSQIFSDLLEHRSDMLLPADGIGFENEMGLSGYVENHPVLVGNRHILQRHGCEMPSRDYESILQKGDNRSLVYIAISGVPCAVMLIEYSAQPETVSCVRRMVESGVGLVVHTCDANITSRLISDIYGIPQKLVSVLNVRVSSNYDRLTRTTYDERPAMLATNGRLSALSEGISAAKRMRPLLTFATIIQMVCYVLTLMLVTALCLVSGARGVNPAQIMAMQLICLAASFVPLFRMDA